MTSSPDGPRLQYPNYKFLLLLIFYQIYFRPLKDGERPLFLTLLWGSAHSGHGFRLKDQMDNSPIWDDFKEAELEAFLRMYEGNGFTNFNSF